VGFLLRTLITTASGPAIFRKQLTLSTSVCVAGKKKPQRTLANTSGSLYCVRRGERSRKIHRQRLAVHHLFFLDTLGQGGSKPVGMAHAQLYGGECDIAIYLELGGGVISCRALTDCSFGIYIRKVLGLSVCVCACVRVWVYQVSV